MGPDPIHDLLRTATRRARLPEPAERRTLRERGGLRQAEMAAALGVDASTLSRWEAGTKKPRGDQLDRYVELLDRLRAALDEAAR